MLTEDEQRAAYEHALKKAIEKAQQRKTRRRPALANSSDSYAEVRAKLPCGHTGPAHWSCSNTMTSHVCGYGNCDPVQTCTNCGRYWR